MLLQLQSEIETPIPIREEDILWHGLKIPSWRITFKPFSFYGTTPERVEAVREIARYFGTQVMDVDQVVSFACKHAWEMEHSPQFRYEDRAWRIGQYILGRSIDPDTEHISEAMDFSKAIGKVVFMQLGIFPEVLLETPAQK